MATYTLTQGIPANIAAGDILNCPYSGGVVTLPLPKGTYQMECYGAGAVQTYYSGYGAYGGYSRGTLTLEQDTTLYLVAGGRGKQNVAGYNGGAAQDSTGNNYQSGGGGGTDIRIGNNSLYARVLVAGGAGAGIYGSQTGHGGGTTGGAGRTYKSGGIEVRASSGGTQTSGGTGGYTRYDYTTPTYNGSAGTFGAGGRASGGGGWYGGGGGCQSASSNLYTTGSGGSGYTYTASTAGNYPSGCLLNSTHYLSDVSMTTGGANAVADGSIKITVIDVKSGPSIPVKIGGDWKDTEAAYVNVNGIWHSIDSINTKVNGAWKAQ